MQVECEWKEKVYFEGKAGSFVVGMDTKSPLGSDRAASPKQLLLLSICGCSAIDVVLLLKKFKQELTGFNIKADAPTTEDQPSIFKHVDLIYQIHGPHDADKVMEAVNLSMTKYCGVSAMVNPTSPIRYSVELNGKIIGQAEANFNAN
jgi:putative redox protein